MERRSIIRLRFAALTGSVVVLAVVTVLVVALPSVPGRHVRGLLVVVAAVLLAGVAAGHVRVLLAEARRADDRDQDPPRLA